MTHDWSKYINEQSYWDCQIVTCLNIYYYLTGEVFAEPETDAYEALVDDYCARIGGAIGISRLYESLGLVEDECFVALPEIDESFLPLQSSVSHPSIGNHSISIVDCRAGFVRVPNFTVVTDDGWLSFSDFSRLSAGLWNTGHSITRRKRDGCWLCRKWKLLPAE